MVFGHRHIVFWENNDVFWGLDGHDCFFSQQRGEAFKNYLKLKHPSSKTNTSRHLGTGKSLSSKVGLERDIGVSKNRGTPKWMVKIMENPF